MEYRLLLRPPSLFSSMNTVLARLLPTSSDLSSTSVSSNMPARNYPTNNAKVEVQLGIANIYSIQAIYILMITLSLTLYASCALQLFAPHFYLPDNSKQVMRDSRMQIIVIAYWMLFFYLDRDHFSSLTQMFEACKLLCCLGAITILFCVSLVSLD